MKETGADLAALDEKIRLAADPMSCLEDFGQFLLDAGDPLGPQILSRLELQSTDPARFLAAKQKLTVSRERFETMLWGDLQPWRRSFVVPPAGTYLEFVRRCSLGVDATRDIGHVGLAGAFRAPALRLASNVMLDAQSSSSEGLWLSVRDRSPWVAVRRLIIPGFGKIAHPMGRLEVLAEAVPGLGHLGLQNVSADWSAVSPVPASLALLFGPEERYAGFLDRLDGPPLALETLSIGSAGHAPLSAFELGRLFNVTALPRLRNLRIEALAIDEALRLLIETGLARQLATLELGGTLGSLERLEPYLRELGHLSGLDLAQDDFMPSVGELNSLRRKYPFLWMRTVDASGDLILNPNPIPRTGHSGGAFPTPRER